MEGLFLHGAEGDVDCVISYIGNDSMEVDDGVNMCAVAVDDIGVTEC